MCGATLATLARIDPDDSIEFGELSSPLSDSFHWGRPIAHAHECKRQHRPHARMQRINPDASPMASVATIFAFQIALADRGPQISVH
jgi:hypothetical protein